MLSTKWMVPALCLVCGSATASPGSGQVIHLKRMPGGALAMEARIGDQEGIFLFDGGWGVSAVSPDMAKRTGCHPWGQLTGFRAIGERVDMPQCQPVTLSVEGHAYPLPTVGVLDIQKFMPTDSPVYAGGIGLDAFSGKTVTLRAHAGEIVVEDAVSLRRRIASAHAIPIRLVRDVEGASLTVDVGIPIPAGTLWMELDTGNTGPTMIGKHIAGLIGLDPDKPLGQVLSMAIVPGVVVQGPAAVQDLILDGDIGLDFLNQWDLTLDLAHERGWVSPATERHGG